ncbi:uncharacterized protein EV420DRAFT_930735 [Desarmillaria tabescens]|uniref:Uncharacterized protein n=1 Tax=Armillaria tabescens TaxID=1929756 RepID=A0AA39NG20_ARMTA|nr:uncharacterized protein EV420DRAFT_930735 [Desarmillaria tabescens]KAK0464964.1 hypothetical protein EV420DRAFT_930735 [Desarmillaria tabescens]
MVGTVHPSTRLPNMEHRDILKRYTSSSQLLVLICSVGEGEAWEAWPFLWLAVWLAVSFLETWWAGDLMTMMTLVEVMILAEAVILTEAISVEATSEFFLCDILYPLFLHVAIDVLLFFVF